MRQTILGMCSLAAASLAMTGCIHGTSQTSLSGTYVGPRTFEKIEVGQTEQSWVKSVLGVPTRQTELNDGGSIWTYSYSRVEKSRGSFLFVIGGSDSDESRGSTFVEFDENGVVRDAWRE